ncbi:4Fe-4S ferredoxin, iron-sulfur binding domain protein [Pyrobaculum islandicum DSM 4184]|uniref:4Fe-4S ferredoxin, iron-sulfur binding domain protein n=1 Tax=Pyrobaculum islandicum (strain DSM 4184 / JCM 9189 / GEO3) TaxID=384616 RepID=A1RQX4_PYRIL|nr:(Fe-S)-binding protein [Pyrobaculum islandicum]ABL87356.1 4Fe-4S ferredoxin, iron-sulfur binding domain protein [Pyrobaculum islandicum DSM 4184]
MHAAEFKLGDTSAIKPLKAPESLVKKLHERIGLKIPEDKYKYFLDRLREEYKKNRNIKIAVDTCVHCGACIDACPTYLTTKDLKNSPVGRAELIRRVLKKGSVTDAELEEIYTYYWQCLTCRRCGYVCPFGIDQADITRFVRGVLYEIGMVNRFAAMTIDAHETTGNAMRITPAAAINILNYFAEEIKSEKGVEVTYYVYRHDQKKMIKFVGKNAVGEIARDSPEWPEAILFLSSADLFLNTETLKGYLTFLNAVKIRFAVHTGCSEVANFGLWTHEKHMEYIGNIYYNAAKELGVKYAIFGECGHGWRAFKNVVAPRLEKEGIKVYHIHHLVVKAIKEGKIKLNPEANGDKVYMYQDPCQYSRGGDLYEEPRFIMNHVVKKWVECPQNRQLNWCCGGQAGMLADEMKPLRLQYAKLWYECAINAGAQHVVRPCSKCKGTLNGIIGDLNKIYGRNITYGGLMDLVYRALVI